MKHPFACAGWLAVALCAAVLPAAAQLPSLDKQPWLGHFAAHQNKRFQVGITGQGRMALTPMGDKDAPFSPTYAVNIVFGIEEMLPGGGTTLKEIKTETLESSQPASDDFEKLVIRGKVTGDAAFEVFIEQERGEISIGGRVTDPGTLTKNPLRFAVRAKIPNVYTKEKTETKKEIKMFEKKMKDDRIDLKWTDGKRLKHNFYEELNASSKEVNGPGIAAAQIEIGAYKGREFIFMASENSAITLSNEKPGGLHQGFTLHWTPDDKKDPEGKARLNFEVK